MRRLLTLLLTIAMLTALLPAGVAGGTDEGTEVQDNGDDRSAVEDVLVDQLGFDPAQAAMFAASLSPVGDDYRAFGWGGDASVPATLSAEDAPWTVPTAVGLNFVDFQDPSRLSGFTSDDPNLVVGTSASGGPTGGTFAVATAVFAEDIPLDSGISGIRQTGGVANLFKQFDFPLAVLGLTAWAALAQFPDDTWNLANFVLSLTYGPSPWALAFYAFNADGGIDTVGAPGFFIVYRNIVMIGVLATVITANLLDISGVRFASYINDAPVNPGTSRVTSTGDTRQPGSFFPTYGHVTVPGLPGQFDPDDAWAIVDPDGKLSFNIKPRAPWGMVPPNGDIFSYFLQVGLFADPSDDFPSNWVDYSQHAGEAGIHVSTPEGSGTGGSGYIMNDGSVLLGTPWDYTGEPFTVNLDGGTLPTEDGQFLFNNVRRTFTSSDVVMDPDPTRHDGLYPVYDLLTGEPVDPPPETTTTTTEATTTTTSASTTAEEPPVAITDTTPVTHGDDADRTCWWCWGVVALFLIFLLAVKYLWLKKQNWWSCWLPWFLAIFLWVPFLLAGLWWWRPTWWWAPLLLWFPLVAGYTWFWAQKRSWWQPWHLYVVGGYLVALAVGIAVVGAPEWGLLLPLFWVPWVGFYLWFRGQRQPWFQPWMWIAAAAFVAWNFVWVAALTPWWAWWLPVLLLGFLAWWFPANKLGWRLLRGPMWAWILPFALLPFMAWWIPLWGPWWCFVIIGALGATVFAAIFNHFKPLGWWTCWLPWFAVIWVALPFLLLGLWFFQPNWWWLPLLGWFPLVAGYTWFWAQKRSWWQPWHLYVVGGYLAAAALLMVIVGSPTWGLLLPVFWLGPAAFYLWYRPRRQPWFQPWMWAGFAAWIGFVFLWAINLSPFWGGWFPLVFLPFFGWWGMSQGYDREMWLHKSTATVPLFLLPWLGYMLAIYCIPAYYHGL